MKPSLFNIPLAALAAPEADTVHPADAQPKNEDENHQPQVEADKTMQRILVKLGLMVLLGPVMLGIYFSWVPSGCAGMAFIPVTLAVIFFFYPLGLGLGAFLAGRLTGAKAGHGRWAFAAPFITAAVLGGLIFSPLMNDEMAPYNLGMVHFALTFVLTEMMYHRRLRRERERGEAKLQETTLPPEM